MFLFVHLLSKWLGSTLSDAPRIAPVNVLTTMKITACQWHSIFTLEYSLKSNVR